MSSPEHSQDQVARDINRRDRVDAPQVYPTWRDYAFSDSPENSDD